MAIVRARIDHHELVVNDGADRSARRQLLDTEIAEQIAIINAGRPDSDVLVVESRRRSPSSTTVFIFFLAT